MNTSNDSYRKKLGIWFIILSQLVVLLVIIGGTVRLSGSGLSIPEWPIINGSLLPPVTESQWEAVYITYHRMIEGVDVDRVYHEEQPGIVPFGQFKKMFMFEYTHRFVAAILTLLFIWVAFLVLRNAEYRKKLGAAMWGLFCLMLLQAILGGIVVKYDLQAEFVAVHLGIAFIFFAFLFWIGLKLYFPPESDNDYNKFLGKLSWICVSAIFIQIVSGGLVAGTQAGHFLNTWPKMADHLLPPANLLWSESYQPTIMNFVQNKVLIQFIHRWWAFAAAILCFIMIFTSIKFSVTARARRGLRVMASLLVLQILLGILTLLWQVPPVMGIIHLAVGMILFAILVHVTYELRNHEVTIT